MEWAEILKLYGPQAIPWIALAYLGKWHMSRMDNDLENRIKFALVLEGINATLKEIKEKMK